MTIRTFTKMAMAVAMTTGLSAAQAQNVGKADVTPHTAPSNNARIGAEPEFQTRPAQPQNQMPGAIQPGQPTTLPAGPTDQFQPAGRLDAQPERYEARRAVNAGATEGLTVQEALVNKLTKANEAEIELAKMAQDKTNNDQVRELTKTLIEDHQALNQSLKQVSKQPGNNADHNTANRGSNDRGAKNWNTDQTNRPQLGQGQSGTTANSEHGAETVPQELCDLGEKACDNALKMTKEMLQEKDGQDFNMAYLGQQCMAHTMMLAELKAIQSDGPQALRPVADKAITTVEKHLDKVKKLAKQLEDDRKDSKDS